MRIIIAGGTGMIGTALAKTLLLDGNQVWILSRNPSTAILPEGARGVAWDGCTTAGWEPLVSQADAIVNLAGASLGAGPWTKARKNAILSSRVNAGKAITSAISSASPRVKILIQASAVGYYGPHGSELVNEDSPMGQGFLADVCDAWEEFNTSRGGAGSSPGGDSDRRGPFESCRGNAAYTPALSVICRGSHRGWKPGIPLDSPNRRSNGHPIFNGE